MGFWDTFVWLNGRLSNQRENETQCQMQVSWSFQRISIGFVGKLSIEYTKLIKLTARALETRPNSYFLLHAVVGSSLMP